MSEGYIALEIPALQFITNRKVGDFMYLPALKHSRPVSTVSSENFGGLNRSEQITDNEFENMENCGNSHFPFIAKREPRNVIHSFDDEIKYCLPPIDLFDEEITGFTGICGDKFYYRGVEKVLSEQTIDRIPYPYSDATLYPDLAYKVSARSFTKFGDVYYSYPQFTFYNTYGASVSNPNWSYTIRNSSLLCMDCYSSEVRIQADGYALYLNGAVRSSVSMKVGDRVTLSYVAKSKKNLCTVDASNPEMKKTILDEYDSNMCVAVSAYITEIYKRTSSSSSDSNCVNMIGLKIYDIKGKALYPTANSYTTDTSKMDKFYFGSDVRISKYIPEIIYTCEFAGRVFGLDAYGEYIYASKLNAPLNFTQYDGLSDSSWYTEVDSSGEWTGMISNSSYLYCFKKDRVYVLYGDNAKNFSVAKSFSPGCIDARSICLVNNNIFYLAFDGIYAYSSGIPQKVSEKLGNFNYKEAVCYGFGSLLYACVKNDDGSELLIFDTDKSIWYRHDDIDIVGFYEHGGKLYGATKHDFICFGDGCEDFEYSVTSKLFTDATSYMRSIVSLYFRMRLSAGSEATVYISYDGGEWQKCGFVQNGKLYDTNNSKSVTEIAEVFEQDKLHKPGVVYSQRVPVRFRAANTYQYKIVCRGDVVIEAIERDVGVNGRQRR